MFYNNKNMEIIFYKNTRLKSIFNNLIKDIYLANLFNYILIVNSYIDHVNNMLSYAGDNRLSHARLNKVFVKGDK
jgi:hypothetical protein